MDSRKIVRMLEMAFRPCNAEDEDLASMLLDAGYLVRVPEGYVITDEGRKLLTVLRNGEPDFNAYLKNFELRGASPRTITIYGSLYSTFLYREHERKPLYLWTRSDVQAFFDRVANIRAKEDMWRRGRRIKKGDRLYAAETLHRLRRMLQGYYAWLRDALGIIKESPARKIAIPSRENRIIEENEFFKEEELKKIFEVAREKAPVWVYYSTVLLFSHALRVSELLPLSKSDERLAPEIFILQDGYVKYRVKGSGMRKRYKVIKATDEELEMLRYVMENCKTSRQYYIWFKRIVNWAKEEMPSLKRVERPHPHMLRHTFYTLNASRGVSRQDLGYLMGWSKKSKMHEVYSHPEKELASRARFEALSKSQLLPKRLQVQKT